MTSQGRRKFDREFKIETVKLVIERDMSVAQISRDIGIHENVLQRWKNRYMEDALHASRARADSNRRGGVKTVEAGTCRHQGGTGYLKKRS